MDNLGSDHDQRGLVPKNKQVQVFMKTCLKSSTLIKDGTCREMHPTTNKEVLVNDLDIDHECDPIHEAPRDLVVEREENDVVNIIYDRKQSRPPDVDTEPVVSNVEHCLTLPMPATARETEERIPSEQDSNSECAPAPQESQHPGVARGESDNDVGDFVRHGKQSRLPNVDLELVESNVECCLASSVQSVPTEAWTTQRIKVLWSKQGYNGEHFPIHQESRTPVIAQRDQDDDVEDIFRYRKQSWPPDLGPQTVKTNSGDLILSESPMRLEAPAQVINELMNPAVEPVLDSFGYVVRRGKRERPPDSKLETWTNDKHLCQSEMLARDSPHNASVTCLDDKAAKAKCCLAT
jgi:hypothetical protein